MKRDSMVLFRSMSESLRKLEPDAFMLMMLSIFDYAMDDVEPDFGNANLEALWFAFKPQIDANKRKFDAQVENGRKGGRPRKPKETQENPKKPKITHINPTQTLYEKWEMRNGKCSVKDTSSSCACAREDDEFLGDEFDENLETYEEYLQRVNRKRG